jgi:hypothetical protein
MSHQPRDAETADLDALAHLWWSGWRDAHLDLVPEALPGCARKPASATA